MKKFFRRTRHLGPVRHGGDRREPVPHVLFLQHLLSPVQSGGDHRLPLPVGLHRCDRLDHTTSRTTIRTSPPWRRRTPPCGGKTPSSRPRIRLAQTNNEENARLRDLLNLRPQNYDLELETASVTERTVTNWTSSLTLNIGTDHGVEVNDCVIDETDALVGVVSEVGLNWCTVLTIVDTDTSLGAQVFRTKDLGLAVGDFSLMRENRLRLDYLPADCQLLGGDLVVTSGLGGYYPSGLSVGTVEEVQLGRLRRRLLRGAGTRRRL